MPSPRSSRPTEKRRREVLAAAGYACQLRLPGCIGAAPVTATGTIPAGELAHLVPLALDPAREWDPTNHAAACRPCNRRQASRLLHRTPSPASTHWAARA